MKKTLKIAAWTAGVLVAAVLLAVLALPLWIGPVVTGVARSVVPEYTGTAFEMKSFSLNPYTGTLAVEGVKLDNPQGYDERTAVSLGSLTVRLDVGSLFTKKIHIREIAVDSLFASYVFDGKMKNNFDRIAEAAAAKSGPKDETKAEEKDEGKRVQIDRLTVTNTKVKMLAIPMPLWDMEFKDIGKDKEEGASFKEVAEMVSEKVRSGLKGIGGALGDGAKAFTNNTKAIVGDGAKAVSEGAKDAAKVVGDGAKAVGEGAKDAAKAVGDSAKKLGEGAADALKKINPFGK